MCNYIKLEKVCLWPIAHGHFLGCNLQSFFKDVLHLLERGCPFGGWEREREREVSKRDVGLWDGLREIVNNSKMFILKY